MLHQNYQDNSEQNVHRRICQIPVKNIGSGFHQHPDIQSYNQTGYIKSKMHRIFDLQKRVNVEI